MCGIVGLYLKNKKYNKDLGKFLTGMMNNMSTRGPDSAGFAIYSTERKKKYKYSICYNKNNIKEIKCFTTRPDTLFGLSFLALSVDHPLSKYYEKDDEFQKFKKEYYFKNFHHDNLRIPLFKSAIMCIPASLLLKLKTSEQLSLKHSIRVSLLSR